MAKARKILTRKQAVTSIHTVTRTMEMVSTARFKQAFKRATSARKYIRGMAQLVENIIERCDTEHLRHPLLQYQRGYENHVVLVLTSDRGLCGGYNSAVVKVALNRVEELESKGKTIILHASGRRGIGLLQNAGRRIAEVHPTLEPQSGGWHDVSGLAETFMEKFLARQIGGVDVVYAKQTATATYETTITKILPLILREDESGKNSGFDIPYEPWETPPAGENATLGQDAFEFVPSAGVMLRRLLPTAIRLQLFQCFMDCAVTEQIARMAAMHAASENAEDMISALNIKYNRTRQGQITTELAEIIGGRAALE